MTFRKILCPVDFSPQSRAALDAAVDLARKAGGTVTLLHVVDIPLQFAFPEVPLEPSVIRDLMTHSEKQLATWKADVVGMGLPSVTAQTVTGTAWEQIVNAARQGGHDLVVVCTHGRTGLAHAFLGSVAERVVRHAHTPVLVVRP
jgi:nucleotide-binding universal stress UspA family protein